MVVAPSFHRSEAVALNAAQRRRARVAIGLHLTLTAPFRPLSDGFRAAARTARSCRSRRCWRAALLRRLDREALDGRDRDARSRTFVTPFGRAPDFIDGHQHVHLFPQVRDALLDGRQGAGAERLGAPVRPRRRRSPSGSRDRKGLLLDVLSKRFRARAAALGVRTNPAFAGTYDFNDDADFAALFPRFLDGLPDGGVVMCHPGFVDAELRRLDPLTTLREQEYAYFAGDAFPELLASHGVALA